MHIGLGVGTEIDWGLSFWEWKVASIFLIMLLKLSA